MGREKYENWTELNLLLDLGLDVEADRYRLLQSVAEWSCGSSLQSQLMLEIGVWLDEKVARHRSDTSKICDLGCGAGLLTSWFAREYPTCQVIGVDALENALDCARQLEQAGNLSFHLWNYNDPKPEQVPRSDFLLCSLGFCFPPRKAFEMWDASSLRDSELYKARKQDVQGCLTHWREASTENAWLLTVLRLPHTTQFLAMVDAAHESGWVFNRAESKMLTVESESFPALAFQTGTAEVPSEDELLAFLAEADPHRALFGNPALLLFRALGDKRILDSGQKTFADGHTMETVLGTSHSLAFSFSRATTEFCRLELLPLTQLDRLQLKFSWND